MSYAELRQLAEVQANNDEALLSAQIRHATELVNNLILDLHVRQASQHAAARAATRVVPSAEEVERIHEQFQCSLMSQAAQQIADNLYQYTIVDRSAAPYADGVEAAVEAFSADLGIPEPGLQFFLPKHGAAATRTEPQGSLAHSVDIAGLCKRDLSGGPAQIFIRADLPDYWDAIGITLHELRHAAQPLDLLGDAAECDADDYAHRKLGRYPFDRRHA